MPEITMGRFANLRSAIERVCVVSTPDEQAQLLNRLLDEQRSAPLVLDFLNQHAGNLLMSDATFRAAFSSADVILRDGIGMRLAMMVLGRPSGLNMNGTDFIPQLVQHFSQRFPQAPIFFFGTKEPWLQRGAHALLGRHAGPVQLADGFQDGSHYCAILAEHPQPVQLVVLGMGMPKQELIAKQLKAIATGATLIVCGGAIIDFAAGKVTRAPNWMRTAGLEWLYRLTQEPQRLFRRYVIGIPIFLSCVLMSRLRRND